MTLFDHCVQALFLAPFFFLARWLVNKETLRTKQPPSRDGRDTE
jgi:hypothetical protein